ncbi:MAG: Zn-ribbon domain-containing OB-fold protein [Chloroflexi bacterium]|nr:Zn-ribbon domain-containing OB-fold protein [Chloroflexota bacterium]
MKDESRSFSSCILPPSALMGDAMSDNEFTNATYTKFLNEHKLMGTRSRADGRVYLPPRPIAPETQNAEMEWVELSGRGKLVAFTIVYVGTSAMIAAGYDRKNPYCVGVVELAEGPKISAQILGVDVLHPEQIKIGMPLQAKFVARGEGDAKKTFLAFEPQK